MGRVVQLRRNLTPPSHPAFAPYRVGLGALGLAPVGGAVVSKGGGIAAAAGATSLAESFGAAGSVAGPIGMAVGAIVGLVAGALFTKNYLNVAQANAGEDQAVQAFNQYRSIAGQVAGRQIGFEGMYAVFLGAVYSGVFPLNNQVKSFHEGSLKYPGNPDWVYGVLYNGANNPYTFAWALQQLRGARAQFAGIPEAVAMVDAFFIPSNAHDSPAWAVPQNPLGHQVLYDAADAYLARNANFTTTPYVASQASGATALSPTLPGSQIVPAASSTTLPAIVPTSAASYANPYFPPGVQPVATATPGTGGAMLNPYATPQIIGSPPGVWGPAGTVTTTGAATSANLDAALAAQGYTRAGTSSQGYPLYAQAGQVYAYENGTLYPFSSVAQLAATGNAGTGASIPATGLDPNTLAAIQAAVAAGMTPQQAAASAASNLQAQGVPVTPTVQGQLLNAASASPSSLLGGGAMTWLLIAGAVGAVIFLARKGKG